MLSIEEELDGINTKKILFSLMMHTPVVITTYTLPRNMETYMQDTLSKFLKLCNQEDMIEYLSFCLGELLTNSKKANTKRVYFKEKGLDINDEDDYKEGMKTFRDDTFSNIEHYLELQKKAGLYIKLILQVSNDFLKVEIRNNSKLTVFEEKRIQEKLDNVHKYSSVEEVLTEVLDQTEGSGLGIIIMVLMLQKVGLSENNFQVISTDRETITRIILPLKVENKKEMLEVGKAISGLRKPIPMIKENLEGLGELLNSPNPDKTAVLDFVSKDPMLVLFLLKMVNTKKQCFDIGEAYDLIGVEALKGAFNIHNPAFMVIDSNPQNSLFWEKTVKVAFFAYNIAINFYQDKNLNYNEIYLLGLIQDFSYLLSIVITEEDKEKLKAQFNNDKTCEMILEEFMQGHYHERREKSILDGWNFPSKIGNVLLYHHDYEHAPEEIKDITEIISFADLLLSYSVKIIDYYQFDEDLLIKYGLNSSEKINLFLSKLDEEFKKFYTPGIIFSSDELVDICAKIKPDAHGEDLLELKV